MPISVEMVPIGMLRIPERNHNKHPASQQRQLTKSIKAFGFNSIIGTDGERNVITGSARVEAAKKAGETHLPCVDLSRLSKTDQRAYAIADNQIARNSRYELGVLMEEIESLDSLGVDLDSLGFDTTTADKLFQAAQKSSSKRRRAHDDHTPATQPVAITKKGDVLIIGRHRLACADAADPLAFDVLMQGEKADAMFADPPWGVPINGHVSGLGRTTHREFIDGSSKMNHEELVGYFSRILTNPVNACRDGAIAFICIGWSQYPALYAACRPLMSEPKNNCIWEKTNAGMGSFYRSKYEMIPVWKVGTAANINNFGLGEGGRSRSNIWTYAGVNGFRAERMDDLSLHPTVKPVALVADAIEDVTHRKDIVLDPFGGSGTTLIAAERCGRLARLMELDPLYCDVIVRRFEQITGQSAVFEASGETFEAVEEKRRAAVLDGWTVPISDGAVA